jgi:hypothetical protein
MSKVSGYVILSYNFVETTLIREYRTVTKKYIDVYKKDENIIDKDEYTKDNNNIDLINFILNIDLNNFDKTNEERIKDRNNLGIEISGYMILLKDNKYFFYNLNLYHSLESQLNNDIDNLNEIRNSIVEKIKNKNYFLTKDINDKDIKIDLIELITNLIKTNKKNELLVGKLYKKIKSIEKHYNTFFKKTTSSVINMFNINPPPINAGKSKKTKKTKKTKKKKTQKRKR